MTAKPISINTKQIGTIELNGVEIVLCAAETRLPHDPDKRKICEGHIANGRAIELYDDFLLQGCDYPEQDENPAIYCQIACSGLSRFSKSCGLTLTQYSEAGKVLNKGKFKS